MARLFIKGMNSGCVFGAPIKYGLGKRTGVDYGPAPFIVAIRDPDTHLVRYSRKRAYMQTRHELICS